MQILRRKQKHKKQDGPVSESVESVQDEEQIRAAMKAQYTHKRKLIYLKKDILLFWCGAQALLSMPMRIKNGPIYPSYNLLTGALQLNKAKDTFIAEMRLLTCSLWRFLCRVLIPHCDEAGRSPLPAQLGRDEV